MYQVGNKKLPATAMLSLEIKDPCMHSSFRVAHYGYARVFQTVAVGRSPSLLTNFSMDTSCKMQA